VAGTLSLSSGTLSNIGGVNMQAGSTISRNSSTSFTGGAPTGGAYNLNYTGTTLTSGAESQGSLNNVNISTSSTVTLASALGAIGDVSIVSGSLTCGANAVTADDLNISGTMNAPSSSLTLTGNFTNSGTFNHNSGTVIFNGTSSFVGTVPVFNHIQIAGTLNAPASLSLVGNFTNNNNFNAAGGTVRFLGATTQSVGGSALTDFQNIDVNNSANPSVQIQSSQNLNGILQLFNSSVFDADGSANASIFTVRSAPYALEGDPVNDASIATIPALAQVTGSITTQRYMLSKGKVNRYISSPVTGATISQLGDDFSVQNTLQRYDETVAGPNTQGYRRVGLTHVMKSGGGYLAFMTTNNNVTWDVSGPITPAFNQGSVDFHVTKTVTGDDDADGWNLLGNPYPCAISWENDAGWTRPDIGTTITIPSVGTVPVNRTYNYADNSGDLPQGIIVMGQAFWAYAETTDASLIVHESAKTISAGGTFLRAKPSPSKQLIVKLINDEGIEDRAFLKTNPEATANYDRDFDAYKLKNEFLNVSLLDKNSRSLVMHTLAAVNDEDIIPLAIDVSQPGEYKFGFANQFDFLGGGELYLVDLQEKISIPVHTDDPFYAFNVSASSLSITNRFILTRKPLAAGDHDSNVAVYPNPVIRQMTVNSGAKTHGLLTLYDLKGNVMMEESLSTGQTTLDLERLPKGIYLLKIKSGSNMIMKKIIKE
jgi:hypothetical protein